MATAQRPPTAYWTSREIRSALSVGDEQLAFRIWLNYNDRLMARDRDGRLGLAAEPPELTGSALYDAALATVTEYRLAEVSAPLPPWVIDAPSLPEPTVLADAPQYVDPATLNVPEPFRRRGVLFDEDSLRSV